MRYLLIMVVFSLLGQVEFCSGLPFQEPESNLSIMKNDITISIKSNDEILKVGNQFIVKLSIVNGSKKPLSLNSFPEAKLYRFQSDRKTQPSTDEFYSIIRFEPDDIYSKKDFVEPGGKLDIEFDLSKLLWAKEGSSFKPSLTLFEAVNSGKYKLHVDFLNEMETDGKTTESRISSNCLTINIVN